tara:strand:+ start:1669 stop:3342 length:1674 start_codon:yes stop_codon:yes gene_type:complete
MHKTNKIILGIFDGIDSGATLSKNGTIIGAVQEERFKREKFVESYPELSIAHLLEENQIKKSAVDVVSIGAWGTPSKEVIVDYFEVFKKNSFSVETISSRLHNSLLQDQKHRDSIYKEITKDFTNASLVFYDHHFCHACCAFYPSSFETSYILTSDGKGDLQSTVIWKADRKKGIQRVKTFSELLSVGLVYSQITRFLGFIPHRHEGKVTGLAAYGKKTKLSGTLQLMFKLKNGIFSEKVDGSYKPYLKTDQEWISKICKSFSKEDIAFATQDLLEKVILDIIDFYVPGDANLSLSGGVFANVKLNQKIREANRHRDMFVFPGMGDGGISYGSCLASIVTEGFQPPKDLNHVFIGNEIPDDFEIDSKKFKRKIYDYQKLLDMSTNLIIEGKIIGLVDGKMEYGPRALGNRSIIASATNNKINKTLNDRLNRTEFMPFAPVTLMSEAKNMYIDWCNDKNTNFMTTCYSVTNEMQKISPACVHIDGTARPQIIDRENSSSLYYDILKIYFVKTGIPNLINTSFNNHEEPIVCSMDDALSSLEKDNVDYILTINSLIEKI